MKNKSLNMNLISLFVSSCVFLYIFGYNFLLSNTTFFYFFDHTLPLTGYFAYINDSWHFPLGVTDKIFPGEEFSILWTDSIPIYSFILKIIYSVTGFKLSNPLPLWYLICYLLLGFYIGKVLQLRVKNYFYYILSIILLVNTPLMVHRMLFHAALCAHWLIVASIYYYLLNKENNFNKLIPYAVNTGISIFIHPYLFTIILPIYIVSLYQALRKDGFNKIKNSLTTFITILILYFLTFASNFATATFRRPDYYKYGAEFNSFFCGEFPNSFIDKYLWCSPPYTQFSKEGYAYFGIGIIFLGLLILLQPKKFFKSVKNNLFLSLTLFSMLIYSLGNKWKIAHVQFFEFEPLYLHKKILEVFRATGRYTWAFYYFVCIYLIFLLHRIGKLKYIILVLALIFQLSEASNNYAGKSSWFQRNDNIISQIELSKTMYRNNPNEVLHVLPDERCEFPYIDHYIVALKYLEYGGTIHSTRTARLRIQEEICKDYNIQKSITTYSPYHFVIHDLNKFDANKFNYTCTTFEGIENKNIRPAYCKLNN